MGAFQRFFVGARAMPKWRRRKHNICSTKEPGTQLLFLDKANGALPRGNVPPTLRSSMADTMVAAITATHGIRVVMICPKLAKKLQIYTRS